MVNGLSHSQDTGPHVYKAVRGQTLSSSFLCWVGTHGYFINDLFLHRVDTGEQSFMNIQEISLTLWLLDARQCMCVSYVCFFPTSWKKIIFILICQGRSQGLGILNNLLSQPMCLMYRSRVAEDSYGSPNEANINMQNSHGVVEQGWYCS